MIDLLWQFVTANNTNDYAAVMDGINTLQDALRNCGYAGALVVAIHSRKAVNPEQPFDDMMGSNGQRGSFSTNIMLKQYRNEGIYTVMSDQTERDDILGEIPETVLVRGTNGELSLGEPFAALRTQAKRDRREEDVQRLLKFLSTNGGCEVAEIMDALAMSKAHALRILEDCKDLITRTGDGVKGSPYRYALNGGPASRQDETFTVPTLATDRRAEELIHQFCEATPTRSSLRDAEFVQSRFP